MRRTLLVASLAALLAGCASTADNGSGSTPRTTAALASDSGNVQFIVDVLGGTAPNVPVVLAIDGLAADTVVVPPGVRDVSKSYQLSPGAHRAQTSIHSSACGLYSLGSADSTEATSQFTVSSQGLPSSVVAQIYCVSATGG